MLKRPQPTRSRWFAGLSLVAVLTVASGWTAWASQPARAAAMSHTGKDALLMTMKVRFDEGGELVTTTDMVAGQPRTFSYDHEGRKWQIVLSLQPRDDGTVFASADITRDGVSQAEPTFLFKPDPQGAMVRIGTGEIGDRFTGVELRLIVALPASAVEPATSDPAPR